MIAIKRSTNGDLIWMDAVLSFQENYSTSVTKHQIESGSTVSDHITQNNATFSLSGVVTGAEFGNSKGLLSEFGVDLYKIDGTAEEILNINGSAPISNLNITTASANPLIKLLPESIKQFVSSDSPPKVEMGESFGQAVGVSSISSIGEIKEILISLNRGFVSDALPAPKNTVYTKEVVTLVEVDSAFKVIKLYESCVCTSLSFAQNPESGNAIYPQMSFEQVRFVALQTTTIPTAVKTKVAPKAIKGTPDNTKGLFPIPAGTETSGGVPAIPKASILKGLSK
jgi:hypothetical protein